MSGFLRDPDGSVVASLTHYEGAILKSLAEQLLELLSEEEGKSSDPLLAMVGISTNDELPDDPVLARLLPNAYEDPKDAAEFRRYTEDGAREKKKAHAHAIRDCLIGVLDDHALDLNSPGLDKRQEVQIVLRGELIQAWLMGINDLRLSLGVRLKITQNSHEVYSKMGEDKPERALYNLFAWLGWLQEMLLTTLAGPAQN